MPCFQSHPSSHRFILDCPNQHFIDFAGNRIPSRLSSLVPRSQRPRFLVLNIFSLGKQIGSSGLVEVTPIIIFITQKPDRSQIKLFVSPQRPVRFSVIFLFLVFSRSQRPRWECHREAPASLEIAALSSSSDHCFY